DLKRRSSISAAKSEVSSPSCLTPSPVVSSRIRVGFSRGSAGSPSPRSSVTSPFPERRAPLAAEEGASVPMATSTSTSSSMGQRMTPPSKFPPHLEQCFLEVTDTPGPPGGAFASDHLIVPRTRPAMGRALLCPYRGDCPGDVTANRSRSERPPPPRRRSDEGRQILPRVEEDLQDRLALFAREVGEFRALVPAAQYLPEAPVEAVLDRLGEARQGIGVDQVAQGIAEESPGQIELPERPPLRV